MCYINSRLTITTTKLWSKTLCVFDWPVTTRHVRKKTFRCVMGFNALLWRWQTCCILWLHVISDETVQHCATDSKHLTSKWSHLRKKIISCNNSSNVLSLFCESDVLINSCHVSVNCEITAVMCICRCWRWSVSRCHGYMSSLYMYSCCINV